MTTINKQFVKLEGGELLEVRSGKVYDSGGVKLLRQLSPVDEVPAGGAPVDQMSGASHKQIPLSAVADRAAFLDAVTMAAQTKRPVCFTDHGGHQRMVAMGGNGSPVLMDSSGIGSPSDFHVPGLLPNYAAGYSLTEGVADVVAPVSMVGKQIDKYPTWDKENEFNRVRPNVGGSNGGVAEVSPTLSIDSYTTVEYALQSFVPSDVIANADGALKPWQKAIKLIQNKLRLEREFRALTQAMTSGNWDSSVITTLDASHGWIAGASSDPIKDLQTAMENSWTPVSRIVMSRKTRNAFSRNAAVRSFYAFNGTTKPIPDNAQLSSILDLPPITVAEMKSKDTSGNNTFVMDQILTYGAVLLLKETAGLPADGEDISSLKTFRWSGGASPDGTMSGGWMVRTYFEPRRGGGRGGYVVVCSHWDAEKTTSAFAGAIILNPNR